jgi:H+/Cl- antiporter ClcA
VSNTDQPGHSDTEVTIRRAPKFGVFLLGGALIGIIVTIVVVALTENIDRTNSVRVTGTTAQDVGFWPTVGYFLLWGIPAGLVLGALVAIFLDWALRRRAAALVAERYDIALPPETVEGEIEDDGQR